MRSSLRAGLVLGVFGMLGTGLVALVYSGTKERIADNERAVLLRELEETLPATRYDNDLLSHEVPLSDEALGPHEAQPAYIALKDGGPAGVVFTVVAPDGYGGPIKLLVGVDAYGIVTGVRVISHHETPGLGDFIDLRRDDWILDFTGKALGNPALKNWTVRKDGGEFDQFTGATITPRAVVGAVRRALIYFDGHRDTLFARKSAPDPSRPAP